jgi:hypothetical protein
MDDLDFFFPDVVSIETSKGESAMGLRAQFSKPGEVVLRGDDTIISEGDVVIRKLTNGLTERYEIINVEYQQGFEELPAGRGRNGFGV